MRLIDADALLEQIVHTNNVYVQGRMAYIIDNMPTAYDVEKVIADLEEVSNRFSVKDFGIKGIIQKAIDIVENGGKK